MILGGARTLHSAVVGENAVAETLSGWEGEAGRTISADVVGPERIANGAVDRPVDCVVVDSAPLSDDELDVVEQCHERGPDVPVVVLADGWADERVVEALSAGAAEVLPVRLAEADPDALAERIVDAVAAERAWTGFRELYDGIAEAATLHDPETGELVHANRTLCELLGYDREELLSMRVGEFTADVPGYDHERAMHVVTSVTDREDPIETEWPVATSDGDVRWIESRLRPVAVGGREAVLWTSVDVTERRRKERKYEQVFDNVNDIISVHDPWAEETVDVNETLCDLTGYGRDALLEMGVDGFSATGSGYTADRAYEVQQEVAATGESETIDWVIETAGGEQRHLECVLSPAEIDGEDRVLVLARDVTQRRRLERTYRELFESVSDGLVIHDPETGEIRDVNERFCEMNGYDRDELVGESIDVVTGPDHAYERAQERIRKAREEGAQLFEWRNRRKDGETFPVEVHLSVVDVRGEECVLASVRDITERKRREREYEQIFDGVTEGIAIQDPETGELLDANRAFVERLGYDDVEALREQGTDGLSVTEEGYTAERARELCQRVMEAGEPETVEWRQETSDGERIWIEATVAPAVIRGEDRIVSMQRDVTERKRREREYEQIFDGVTDAITIHHPETGELLDLNETMCELTGYDREELLAEGQEAINVPGEGYSSERSREIIREVMAADSERSLEWLIERADGQRRWLEINATPATLNGERRYLAIMRDVTEQRRTERRLREILERIDEAIYLTRAAELTNPTLREDDLSAGYESIWGESLETIFERYDAGFFDTLHPDEKADYREFVAEIGTDLDEGTPADRYSREYRIVRADGTVRWVRSDFYTIEWPTGPLRVVILSRDITDRKARERRIASFDDATDDLATADAPAEATRTAVEAATETLDLPAVGAFLYDGEEGVLRPEVLSGPLPSAVETAPIGPGDGPLWEGFASGTVVAADGGRDEPGLVGADDAPPAALADLADWRAIALGNHGILLVGSPEESLGSETIQAAHVLAATLEAALNHLQGRQRLAAQQEQLQTQTERAERLDRIARLTQQVEAAITDASTPEQVERAVCDRLAGSGPYDLAWIGGVEVGSDRLVPRAVVGASDRYVQRLDLTTTGDAADPHPAVAAWRTGDLSTADSIVGTGPADDWRSHVLSAGFQSLCAVPLTDGSVTQGVLTIGTDAPNTITDREREVLSQLGSSIANALAAIERRRALESDETVELAFRGSGEQLPVARAAAAADCRVSLARTAARQDGTVSVYFEFEGDVPERARQALGGDVGVVTEEESSTLVEVRTDDWFGSPLAEYGGVLREATAAPGETTVTVEVPEQADVRSFVERLQAVAPSLELVARRQHRRQDRTPAERGDRVRAELTDRQYEVLQTALAAGYFEWPRENDGSDVAERLDITQPTLNKHLRLAEKQTFTLLFGDDSE